MKDRTIHNVQNFDSYTVQGNIMRVYSEIQKKHIKPHYVLSAVHCGYDCKEVVFPMINLFPHSRALLRQEHTVKLYI
jgi:hypothetical protein